MLKFILGFKDWRNKTKEMYYSSLFCKVISFVIQGSEPRMNFNKFLIIEMFWSIFANTYSPKICSKNFSNNS